MTTALSVAQIRDELLTLARHGRVLVLLDACHSGAMTMDGTPLAMDSDALRNELDKGNISVITASSSTEKSVERRHLRHGVFTKAVIDAFPAADADRDGYITPTEFFNYIDQQVRWRTDSAQSPKMELRGDNITLFAAGPLLMPD